MLYGEMQKRDRRIVQTQSIDWPKKVVSLVILNSKIPWSDQFELLQSAFSFAFSGESPYSFHYLQLKTFFL